MDRKLKKSIYGFIISPIVGLAIIFLLLIGEWIIGNVFNVNTLHAYFLDTMIGILITIGIPGVYIITCLIGIPTFNMLAKYKLTKWNYYLYSGFIWGAVISGINVLILKGFPVKGLICLFFSNELVFGLSMVSYWWIAVREW